MKLIGFLMAITITFSGFAQNEEIEFNTDFTEGTDFTDYESYFWVVDDKLGENTWISVNTMQAAMIKDAIEFKMDIEEYQKNPENPEILINYHIFDQDYDVEAYVATPPYDFRYMENRAKMENITDGTLVISVFNTEKGKVIWEGYATNVIQDDNSLRENQKNIRYAVANILNRFESTVIADANTTSDTY